MHPPPRPEITSGGKGIQTYSITSLPKDDVEHAASVILTTVCGLLCDLSPVTSSQLKSALSSEPTGEVVKNNLQR